MGWGIPPEGERPVCFFFKEFLLDPSDLGGSLKKEDISLRGGPRNWVEKNRPPAAAVVRSAARGGSPGGEPSKKKKKRGCFPPTGILLVGGENPNKKDTTGSSRSYM